MLKLCLLLLGLVAALAVLASAENNEEASLTDGIVSSRVARSAEAEAGRKKRKLLKRKRVKKKGSKKAKTALNKAQKKLKIRENKARKKIGNRKRAKRKIKKIEKRKSKRTNVRKNKNDQKQGRKRQSGRCFDDVVQSMKEYKKATNHLRMAKRVSSWTETMAKKKAKAATVFQETLEALNSSCVGSEDVATTAALATLTNCSASAAAACDSTSLNISNLESCITTLMTQIDAFDVGGQLKLHLFLHS